MRTRNRALAAVGLLALAAGWWALAPTSVGGRATYVVTHGNSMAPRFSTGDLAIVLPADSYRVGDVVAYHSPLLGTVVMHRIVGRSGDGFVLKGDNNAWLDPEHPRADQITGRLWLRIPQGGRIVAFLHTPATAALLAAGIVLAGASHRHRRRRLRRRQARAKRATMTKMSRFAGSPGAVAGLAAVTLLLGVAALAAFGTSTTASVKREASWVEQVRFGYAATVPANVAYPDGRVSSGEPIFRRLVRRLELDAQWSLRADAPHRVQGSARLVGTVRGTSGWTRTLDLGPSREFTGDRVTVRGTLDLPELDRLIGQVATVTGIPGGSYSVDVRARVELKGQLAGQPLNEVASGPTLKLAVAPAAVVAEKSDPAAEPAAEPAAFTELATATQSHTATTTRTEGKRWPVLGLQIRVTTVRGAAGGGFVLAALLLALLLLRSRDQDEAGRIAARHGRSIVQVSSAAAAGPRTTVDVTGMDALARIAQRYERLILHLPEPADTYLVEDEGTVYRYQPRPVADRRRPGRPWSDQRPSDRRPPADPSLTG